MSTENRREKRSALQRYQDNLEAIHIVKRCAAEVCHPTQTEREALALYSGWGDTAVRSYFLAWKGHVLDKPGHPTLTDDELSTLRTSVLTAFYTPPAVAKAVCNLAARLMAEAGQRIERVLEPSCGAGAFIEALQTVYHERGAITHQSPKIIGVEMDHLTADICAARLGPSVRVIRSKLEHADLPTGSFDLIVGNVPFGDFAVADKTVPHDFLRRNVHDYFVGKSVSLLRPGGVLALLTSTGTLDKIDRSVRRWLASQCHLVGALRLPSGTFGDTDATTDLIVLQKRTTPVSVPTEAELKRAQQTVMFDDDSDEDAADENEDTLELPSWAKWIEAKDIRLEGGQRAPITTYYLDFPSHVLGELTIDKHFHRVGARRRPHDAPIAEMIESASRFWTLSETTQAASVYEVPPSPPGQPTETAVQHPAVVLATNLYQGAKGLLRLQADGESNAVIERVQRRLLALYDSYVRSYGRLSLAQSRKSHPLRTIADPPESSPVWAFLMELESSAGNANIPLFERRLIQAGRRLPNQGGSPLSPQDALYACLDAIGHVDLEWIAKVCSSKGMRISTAHVREELRGLVYRNPSGHTDGDKWVTADRYLSGDVRTKLQIAQKLATVDDEYVENVIALEAVQPPSVAAADVSATFGAGWVPRSTMIAFLRYLFPVADDHSFHLKWVAASSSWIFDCLDDEVRRSEENRSILGTPDLDGISVIEHALDLKLPIITDEIETINGKKKVRNDEKTIAAQGKVAELRERWAKWSHQEPQEQSIADAFNAIFGGHRPRQHDGAHLTFPGLVESFTPHKHQRGGAARILTDGDEDRGTLLTWRVGQGKTAGSIVGVVKRIQLGLSRKACFVVPKHLIGQWRRAFVDLYPGLVDELLTADADDFGPSERKRFLSRCALTGYRYVLLTYEQFKSIPLAKATFDTYLDRELEDLRSFLDDQVANSDERKSLEKEFKRREKSLAKYQAKYEETWNALAKGGKQDESPITWDELGFDLLTIDEWHLLKNDIVTTRMTNVAGLPRADSQRAFDARTKAHVTMEQSGRVIGLTGTPITNTLGECYVAMRFFQPNLLRRLKLWHFDSWAATFAEPFASVEMDSLGKFRTQTRLRFQNIQKLMILLGECWDRVSDENDDRPDVVGGAMRVIEVAGSEALIAYNQTLAVRAEAVRKRLVDPTEDNMLVITSDGRKSSLFNGDPNCGFISSTRTKVDALIEQVWAIYCDVHDDRGTQLIFCDLLTPATAKRGASDAEIRVSEGVYGEIKRRLVAAGMLPEQVEYVHDATTDDKKTALYARVNDGRCRVLIGSTTKMATGINVQRRVIAVHHLTAPWRPDWLEQANGRGVRVGNMWDAVHVVTYVTQRSYDPVIWQIIEQKARMIQQIASGTFSGHTAEDVGDIILSAGLAKAIALGNPLVLDKIRLEAELTRYQKQYNSWLYQRAKQQMDARQLPEMIARQDKTLEAMHAASRALRATHGATFSIRLKETVGDNWITITDMEKANLRLYELGVATRHFGTHSMRLVGEYRGATIEVGGNLIGARIGELTVNPVVAERGRHIQTLEYQFALLDGQIASRETAIKGLRQRLATLERERQTAWLGSNHATSLLAQYWTVCDALIQDGICDSQHYDFNRT